MAERLAEPAGQKSVAVDLARSAPDAHRRTDLELTIVNPATQPDANTGYRRRSVPGIGTRLRRVLRSDIHAIRRFPRGQACVSDCRLGTCANEAAGPRSGPWGTQLGHADRPWAFSAAAGRCWRDHPAGQKSRARVAKPHGKGKALTLLAPPLARAVYSMRQREGAGARPQVLHGAGRGAGEPSAALDDAGISLAMALCHA
jgi:hypothetical protein